MGPGYLWALRGSLGAFRRDGRQDPESIKHTECAENKEVQNPLLACSHLPFKGGLMSARALTQGAFPLLGLQKG